MGLPAVLLMLLLPPSTSTTPATTVSPCWALLPTPHGPDELDLSNRSRGCAELDWRPFHGHRQVKLRHNNIEALSPSSHLGPRTEELDLAENRLQELPHGFFTNATSLRILRLEGNPLPAVPTAAFHPSLTFLSVSCRCDVLGTVLTPCARPGIRCECFTSHQHRHNVTGFHSQECGPGAGLVAGAVAGAVAGVAVLVAGLVAVVRCQRRRAGAAVGGVGRGEKDLTGNLRQPRYISRDVRMATADVTDVTDSPDYENVFVSPGRAPTAPQGWAQGWQEQRYR